MTTKKLARQLWAELRTNLIATEESIKAIIKAEAWKPLGYATFTEAWKAQMADISIAAELKPHVAYQMFAEGSSPDLVAEVIKGIGDRRAAVWQREQADGVPPELANRGHLHPGEGQSVVKEHFRGPYTKVGAIRIPVGENLQAYRDTARRLGTTVENIALAAVTEVFDALNGTP